MSLNNRRESRQNSFFQIPISYKHDGHGYVFVLPTLIPCTQKEKELLRIPLAARSKENVFLRDKNIVPYSEPPSFACGKGDNDASAAATGSNQPWVMRIILLKEQGGSVVFSQEVLDGAASSRRGC